ncbi:MSMEG_1061 family FMN-dependent PPOX-type flavoprotein [Streptomyces sp. NPDC054796]
MHSGSTVGTDGARHSHEADTADTADGAPRVADPLAWPDWPDWPDQGGTLVTSEAELSALVGEPHPIVIDKVTSRLGDVEQRWLRSSPFVFLGTSADDGTCDVSPKGDPAGFVEILDDRTIAIPDRPGNRRVDGWRNLLTNPHLGLIALVPGQGMTLRVNGRARLVRDAPFFDRLALDGRPPALALLLRTDEVYFHCSRALTRSGVWNPETWDPDRVGAKGG